MNKKGTFCGLLLTLLLFMMVFSCKVKLDIPEKKMVSILVDIHLADGVMQTDQTSHMHGYVDSIQVYGPIIEKYGYTMDEFRNSIGQYMENPRIFERVYTTVIKELKERQSQYSYAVVDELKQNVKEEDMETYLRYVISVAGDTLSVWW